MHQQIGLHFRIKAASITTWSTIRVTFIIYRRTISRCLLTGRITEREIRHCEWCSNTFAHVSRNCTK